MFCILSYFDLLLPSIIQQLEGINATEVVLLETSAPTEYPRRLGSRVKAQRAHFRAAKSSRSPWFTEWQASLKCHTPFPLGPQGLICILCFVEQKTAFQWPWSSVPSHQLPSIPWAGPLLYMAPTVLAWSLWNWRLLDTHRLMMGSEVINQDSSHPIFPCSLRETPCLVSHIHPDSCLNFSFQTHLTHRQTRKSMWELYI